MGKHVFVGEQEQLNVRFSIVIPAHNEEKYIGHCLESIKEAAEPFQGQVEVIVVLNVARTQQSRSPDLIIVLL